jgi:phosphoribosylamine---glycine ligase
MIAADVTLDTGALAPPRRIAVLGGGAREHALAARFASERGVDAVHVAPGNVGMRDVATTHPEVLAARPERVVALAREARIDLVVVGPEAPLVDGLVDALTAAGITAFGPGASAAVLEGSKSACRTIASAAGVAMADGRAFDGSDGRSAEALAAARAYARELGGDVVVKADGLAGGKGVSVCRTIDEADAALEALLQRRALAAAGQRVIVERRLDGREASVIALCDGETALALLPARDHKRAGEGDTGPNTGGMGAYAPVPDLSFADVRALLRDVHLPVLREMARRGTPFRGALFAGLMLTADGPRLLEFNVRFGDPETQVVLPLLSGLLPRMCSRCGRGRRSGSWSRPRGTRARSGPATRSRAWTRRGRTRPCTRPGSRRAGTGRSRRPAGGCSRSWRKGPG